jgi:hypothetical protein
MTAGWLERSMAAGGACVRSSTMTAGPSSSPEARMPAAALSPSMSRQAASARRPKGSMSCQLRTIEQALWRWPIINMAWATVVAIVGSE